VKHSVWDTAGLSPHTSDASAVTAAHNVSYATQAPAPHITVWCGCLWVGVTAPTPHTTAPHKHRDPLYLTLHSVCLCGPAAAAAQPSADSQAGAAPHTCSHTRLHHAGYGRYRSTKQVTLGTGCGRCSPTLHKCHCVGPWYIQRAAHCDITVAHAQPHAAPHMHAPTQQ
jgi:hypothetical protein